MICQYCHTSEIKFLVYPYLYKESIELNESDYQIITDFINGVKPLVIYRDDEYYSVYCIINIKDYKISCNKDNIYISSHIHTHEFEIIFSNNRINIKNFGRSSAWRGYLIKSQIMRRLDFFIERTEKHLKNLNDFKKGLEK